MILLTSNDFYGIKLPAWGTFIVFGIIVAVIYAKRGVAVGKEVKSQRAVYFSYVGLVLGYVITRILFLFSDIERLANGDSQLYIIYVLTGYLASTIGFTSLIIVAEKYLITNTKYIFSILISVLTAVLAVLIIIASSGVDVRIYGRTIIYSVAVLGFPIVFFLYSYIAVKATGHLRNNAIITLVGMVTMVVGVFSDTDSLTSSGLVPYILPPIITAIGVLIISKGLKQI